MGLLPSSGRDIYMMAVGIGALWAFHRFVKPVKGKGGQ